MHDHTNTRSLHRAAAEKGSRGGRGGTAHLGWLRNLGDQVAFAGGEKQVGIDTMLARVQIVVTAPERVERVVRAALHDAAILHHEDLLGTPDGVEAGRDEPPGPALP